MIQQQEPKIQSFNNHKSLKKVSRINYDQLEFIPRVKRTLVLGL